MYGYIIFEFIHIHMYTNSHAIFYEYGRSSGIRTHTYIHIHTGGRWWQRALMAYFVLNIQICPVLDEDLHHLQMAFSSGPRKSSISLLSETDTHSERNATACHHTLPPYRLLSIYKHTYIHMYIRTYIHTICIFKNSCASIYYCIHTYIMGIHADCAHRDTSLSHTGDYLRMDIH